MQFKHEKDFILRRATASDQGEILSLIQKYGDLALREEMNAEFFALCQNPELVFHVALNSNGVVIAFVYTTQTEWKALVANPNFLKQELRAMLLDLVREGRPTLYLRPKLIVGDWKSFVKKQGAKIEVVSGREQIQF